MSAFWNKNKEEKEEKKEVPEKGAADVVEKKSKSEAIKSESGKKEEKNTKQEKAPKKVEEKKAKKSKKKKKQRVLKPHEANLVSKTLVQPKVSEAVMNQQVLGKYVFEVSGDSTKDEIARAVEAKYGVTVERVNTIIYKKKSHGFKGRSGFKKGFKKAIVSLKAGESIELFSEAK